MAEVRTLTVHIDPDKTPSEKLIRSLATHREPNVEGPTIGRTEDGRAVFALLPYEGDLSAFRNAVLNYPCDTTTRRAAGIRNQSRVFGFISRSPVLRRAACSHCNGAIEHPEAHAGIVGAAKHLAEMLNRHLPEIASEQLDQLSSVLPEWKMPGGMWTSGVVNKTSNLAYHYDRNNFDAWSAMPVVRRHTRGGHLHIPRMDAVLKLNDGDVLFFNGQEWVHGVTPITLLRDDAYRYSCVFYPVKKMKQCLPWEEELAHAKQWRTDNEQTLIERQRANGMLDG